MTTFMKTASSLAVAAATGFLATSAMAADLGGNCCTDLEERVAELEATTVRKGNRKVSLQVYGQVSEAIIFWNDGAERNIYIQENNNIKNTVGFQGSAKITSDWSAGFKLELQVRALRSSAASQVSFGDNNGVSIPAYNTQSVALRHAYWYLQSNSYGRITVGRDVDAATGTSSISLVNPDGFAGPSGPGFAMGGYFLRRAGTVGNGGLSAFTGFGATNGLVGGRNGDGPLPFDYAQTNSGVKYTSPFFLGQTKSSGFQFSANAGQDDAWAVALRYAEEFGAFRFAAGVSYSDWSDIDRGSCSNPTTSGQTAQTSAATSGSVSNVSCSAWQTSASLMHTPTGLYVSGGGAQLQDDNRQVQMTLASAGLGNAGTSATNRRVGVDSHDSFWWIQAGWQAKLNPLGNTIFWGQYVDTNYGAGIASGVAQSMAAGDTLNSLGATALIGGGASRTWSLGVSQVIDAAAMTLYAGVQSTAYEATIMTQTFNANSNNAQRLRANPIDDMQVFYTGATIKF